MVLRIAGIVFRFGRLGLDIPFQLRRITPMKRFVIPAFFVIDAETEDAANALAGEMQSSARQAIPLEKKGAAMLFLDEGLPGVEIPIKEDEDMPHSYLPVMSEALFATSLLLKVPTYDRYKGSPTVYSGNAVDIP